MDYKNSYLELGAYANDLIRSKARTLIGKAGFTSADCEDIEQELALDLLARLENYDPKKSKRNSFMARVVEHRISTLLEERHAACRDWRLCRESLDDPEWQEREEGTSRIENQPDPTTPTRDDLALEMDLRNAVENLPPDLRDLWERLLHSNIHRVAREIGIPRTTLYYHLKRLRAALREAGL